jgi:hypothetical protein
MMDGNREIVLWDKELKHNGRITANDIEDSQPVIGGFILAWKGDRGDDAEIYTYEIPHITLVSPADGSEFTFKELTVFVWDSSYIKFKIEFSTLESFEWPDTLTFPEETNTWLNEPSITLDKKQVNNLKSLWENQGGAKLLYWRVLAQDSSGNEQISQARHIYVSF